jgi:hypothetical protein
MPECVRYPGACRQALYGSLPRRPRKGHVVAEAWIDGLDAWVLLDGQNGMYWIDENGTPLGVPMLQQYFLNGGRRAPHVAVGPSPVTDADAEVWWRYFAHASPTGATWSATSFVPIFQTTGVVSAEVLLRDRAEAYPDLAEIAIGITTVDGAPAVRAQTEHPFASGFQITAGVGAQVTIALDGAWVVPRKPAGLHEARIATVTPYGTLTPSTLVFRVS